MRKYIITLFIISSICIVLPTIKVFAQSKILIVGILTDTLNKPIPNINVVTYKVNKDTIFHSFSLSNNKGIFQLSIIKNCHFIIVAKSLDYKTSIFDVFSTDTVSKITHNFRLIPKLIELNEVVIKGQVLPIIVKKDTVVYSVKAYSDGTERNVEDLLKKLPGIKVGNDGKITVRGKPVQKVLIDGEDIFSKNYQLITRNLTIDAINKIEAIDNYQENNLLRDIEKTGKVVINLSVKNELKLKVFGNSAIGVGSNERFQGNGAVFSLIKKLKFGIVGNGNNVGVSPITDVALELNTDNEIQKLLSAINNPVRAINNNQIVDNSDISSNRYVFNRAGLLGWDFNYHLSDSLKIKTFGYYSNDKNSVSVSDNYVYFLDSGNITVKDSIRTYLRPTTWVSQIKVDYKINSKSSLHIISDIKKTDYYRKDFYNSENIALTEKINQDRQTNTFSSNNQLNYFYRLKGKNVISFNLSYSSHKLPEISLVKSLRYASFFNVSPKYDSLVQQNNTNQQDWISNFYWKRGTSTGNFKIGIGIADKSEVFDSKIQLLGIGEVNLTLDSNYQNLSSYHKRTYLVEGLYEFKIKNFKLSLGGSFHSLNSLFDDFNNKNNFNFYNLLFNPTVGLNLDFANHQNLWFYYNRLQTTPNIQDLANGYILNNYQSFNRNLSVFNIINSDFWLLMYQNNNWSKLFSLSASASYTRNNSTTASNYKISNTIIRSTTQPVIGNTNNFNVNLQLDKFINPLSSRIQFTSNFTQGNQLFFLNSKSLSNSDFQLFDNKLLIRTLFKGILNFEISNEWIFNRTILSNNTISNQLIKPNLLLKLTPFKDWIIKVKFEKIIRNQFNKNTETNFLDANVNFEPNNSKWSFELIGSNLLDNRQLLYSETNNFLVYQKLYNLQPRFIVFKVERQF